MSKCNHNVSFFQWLLAVDYYGYYICKSCGTKIHISKHIFHFCRWILLLSLLLTFGVVFVGNALDLPWIRFTGIIIGPLLVPVAYVFLWKSSIKQGDKASSDTYN